MFIQHPDITLERLVQRLETEQFGQQAQEISLLQGSKLFFSRPPLTSLPRKGGHRLVIDDSFGRDGCAQHQPLQRAAPTQGHISLPMSKGSPHIDDGFIKRQPLTLMNGNGPSQLQGILPEGTLYLFRNFLRLFIESITGIGPHLGL